MSNRGVHGRARHQRGSLDFTTAATAADTDGERAMATVRMMAVTVLSMALMAATVTARAQKHREARQGGSALCGGCGEAAETQAQP